MKDGQENVSRSEEEEEKGGVGAKKSQVEVKCVLLCVLSSPSFRLPLRSKGLWSKQPFFEHLKKV